MKTETRFVFIGTEEDRKNFVDPEPVSMARYTHEQFDKFKELNEDNINVYKYFTTETVQVPEPIQDVKDVLTPMIRIEVLKIWTKYDNWDIKEIERYVAFGEYPS